MVGLVVYRIIRKTETLISRLKNRYLCSRVIARGKIRFGSQAQIVNAQGDPSKIIIGDNTLVDGILQVFPFGAGIEIGRNCYVGQGSRIWAADKITIGDNVLISHNVNIVDTNSHEIDYMERTESAARQFREGLPKSAGSVKTAPIVIKDHAWLSFDVCVLKGVTIGRGAIIGCGAVVTHDIPDFTLAVGNPARVVKNLLPNENGN
ncbi:MAG: acyltransferase [Muribaculaceae bacterium]|nr:acyltransferase [Muribaculaceae bacterium]